MAPKLKKNSKNLIHFAKITDDPQKAIEEYFISKAEEKNIK